MASTCRLCHGWEVTRHTGPMLQYAVRHHAHARCAIVRYGVEWMDKQPAHVIQNFPDFLARDLKIEYYLRARLLKIEGDIAHGPTA